MAQIQGIKELLAENLRRHAENERVYDPIAGDREDVKRFFFDIPGLSDNPFWLPETMKSEPMVIDLLHTKSVDAYIDLIYKVSANDDLRRKVNNDFVRLRIRHDFPYWAAKFVYIKPKGGGGDVLFVLNRPQRRLVAKLETMRTAHRPIRMIIAKARQWGGSTCVQLYMAWLQMVHSDGLNSLIIAHQGIATCEIKDMFDRMLDYYPDWLLFDGDGNPVPGRRMSSVGGVSGMFRIRARNCKVKLGSAERPDACRGGDYNLLHCSEVAMWPQTPMKNARDMIRSACSGILYKPLTMIVLESTAKGTGNYFHDEYIAAKAGKSQFESFFVPWFDDDRCSLEIEDIERFAERLYNEREDDNEPEGRQEKGSYHWQLWEKGATLEAINWYMIERTKYADHAQMASEYPSDDVEAFVHAETRVFDKYQVENFREMCENSVFERGEVDGDAQIGPDSLRNVRFNAVGNGELKVWVHPEKYEFGERVANRYLTVVDIGGRSQNADWSVIAVIDRKPMLSGEPVEIVAQWRGHTDIDILAWKAARIARYYDDALLVIESNTIETREADRFVEGDQSGFIFQELRDCYANLYAREQSSEEIRTHAPKKYGFHTNVATKPLIITNLIQAVREGGYVEREEECLKEYLEYECRKNGSYGAIPGKHDDILMTRAIGLYVSRKMEAPRMTLTQNPYGKRRSVDWY